MPRRRLASASGGKRPGAGAPKGNLNAFKTGRRSKQLQAVTNAILADPALRPVILKLHRLRVRRNQALKEALRDAAKRHERRSISQKRTNSFEKAPAFTNNSQSEQDKVVPVDHLRPELVP